MEYKKYLERIGFKSKPSADLKTLKILHLKHLLTIPFENLDIHTGKKILLDPDLLFNKIIENRRGGFCYELNGLFYELLISLGFETERVSARVYDTNEPGPEFDHMALTVKINSELMLADVGFGDSFLEPLIIIPGLLQEQYGKFFRIDKFDDENFIVTVSANGNNFSNMYRFSLKPRILSEFNKMCEYHQTSNDSHFTKNRFISIAKQDGRISLAGLKLKITKNGLKTESILDSEEEFNNKVKSIFEIDL